MVRGGSETFKNEVLKITAPMLSFSVFTVYLLSFTLSLVNSYSWKYNWSVVTNPLRMDLIFKNIISNTSLADNDAETSISSA